MIIEKWVLVNASGIYLTAKKQRYNKCHRSIYKNNNIEFSVTL
jgi:hypothetical protein